MKKIEYIDSIKNNTRNKRERIFRAYKAKILIFKFLPVLLLFLFNKNLLINIILGCLYIVFYTMFFDHLDIFSFSPGLHVWFGVPGAGKTTMAALLCRESIKQDYKVLSNVALKGSYKLDINDLGVYDMSFNGAGCHSILDEASLNFDNRLYMQFVKTKAPQYFSLVRHMFNRSDLFSQGYDIDKRIRDRVAESGLHYLKRSIFKGFVYYRQISKVLIIEKEGKQMIDGFEFRGLPRFVYCRSVWDSFDTYDLDLCPKEQKDWQLWFPDEDLDKFEPYKIN